MLKSFMYDYSLDIFTVTVNENFVFDKSLELEDGVILDFDNEGVPISIEILDISKRLGIKKQEIKNADMCMEIVCTSDVLKIEIRFYYKIHEKTCESVFNSEFVNDFNIPPIEIAIA